VVVFVGYALMFVGSLPAVVLSPDGSRELILAGQDLGFLGALVAGVGAIPLGIALWHTQSGSRAGALLLIISLPIGTVGTLLVSALGFADIAGLPLTVLYGGAWMSLGGHLGWQGSATVEQSPPVR
jgi:O-antigen ligase